MFCKPVAAGTGTIELVYMTGAVAVMVLEWPGSSSQSLFCRALAALLAQDRLISRFDSLSIIHGLEVSARACCPGVVGERARECSTRINPSAGNQKQKEYN